MPSRCTRSANWPSETRMRPPTLFDSGKPARRRPDMAVPQTTNANDISAVIAHLASRQATRPKGEKLSGPKRAALLMLALGEKYGGKGWSLLDDDEVRALSM